MFQFDQKVLFKHCDPAGIVFYPRYFEMINDSVEAFFNHLGHPFEVLHQNAAVPTAQIETQFTAPSRHGDHLTLTLETTKLGRSSVDLSINAHAGNEARFICTSTLVYTTPLGKPTPWPDDLRAALTSHIRSTT